MTQSEHQTRIDLIDRLLSLSGWSVKDRTQVIEEFEITIPSTECDIQEQAHLQCHQYCDYVLLGKNSKPLAVVEAK